MKNLRITALSFFLGLALFFSALCGMHQISYWWMIPIYVLVNVTNSYYWTPKYRAFSIKNQFCWWLVIFATLILALVSSRYLLLPNWWLTPLTCLLFLSPNLFALYGKLNKPRLTIESLDRSRKWLDPEVKPILREQLLNSVTKSLDTITKGEELADLPMPEEPLWQMEMEVFKELDQQSGANLFGPAIEEMEQQLPAFLESKMENGKLDVKYYIRYPDGCRQLASRLGKLVVWHNDYQVGVLLG